jgi:hypothetical protein
VFDLCIVSIAAGNRAPELLVVGRTDLAKCGSLFQKATAGEGVVSLIPNRYTRLVEISTPVEAFASIA